MGNKHSVHHVPRTRRQSLMKEEFDFPQPVFDFFDDDWEIYHVEVELKILPPHARTRIKIHVHDYTQEIISEECTGEATPSETEKDLVSEKERSREITSSETEKNHVRERECSREINLSETEKKHVCVDPDVVSVKKPRDESGLRPACFRGTALSSTSTDFQDRTSTVGIRLRDGNSSTKCSQCQCVIETGSWQADVSNENLTNKNVFSAGYDVSNENLTNKNIFSIECSQDSVSNDDLTDTNVASKEDQAETDCVSNDVFLQWELSLEEPCCREDGNMKACRTKENCDLNQLRFAGQDASCDRNTCSPDDTDVDVATTFSTVDQCDAGRDVFPNATSPEAISSKNASSNAASSNATCSNDTASNATSFNDTSSLKCGNQKTALSAGPFSRLCDTCSSSATQNTARSLPVEITTASAMLPKPEPEESLPMEIPTASTMLCKARPHLRSARRKMSDPVLRLKASTPVGSPKLNAKPRKFSLKDDPGWIPNPLDSDSDGEELEDSGVFSDSTGSPRSPAKLHGSTAAGFPSSPRLAARMEHYTATVDSSVRCSARVEHSSTTADSTAAPEPPLREYPTAEELVRKRLALQTGGRRRRYNSEPTPVAPKTPSADTLCGSEEELGSSGDSRPSSVSDDSTCSKSQSRWRLVKLIWGRRASKADAGESAAGVPSSSSGKEDEQQQEDLDQQLEWMTEVPGSEPPTPSEDLEAVDFGAYNSNYTSTQDPPTRRVTFSDSTTHHENLTTESPPNSSQAAKLLTTSEDPEDQGRDVVGQELELDWLCEPEWNNFELELFWSVLRPHMEQLLEHGDAENLPDPCDTVFAMDAGDHKMLDRCLLHVQWHIWKGNYCQAVSDFRAVRRHFRCCAESHLIQSETRDDVENLRLVFQRKRPSRFRLWI
ncbi:serine-rich adhesin for platelets-like isoform X2 [Littorina saxatilis]|uniref:serine-rich adhesin for platelets-like isoform X2 n=1 Tax=Littorina saxatilis TaxID=31220 RepID=UPI0038B54565